MEKKAGYICPVCQAKLECMGKYATYYVYQCTDKKCRRKWNKDTVEAKEVEAANPSARQNRK